MYLHPERRMKKKKKQREKEMGEKRTIFAES
jgi:hypothetical protein